MPLGVRTVSSVLAPSPISHLFLGLALSVNKSYISVIRTSGICLRLLKVTTPCASPQVFLGSW